MTRPIRHSYHQYKPGIDARFGFVDCRRAVPDVFQIHSTITLVPVFCALLTSYLWIRQNAETLFSPDSISLYSIFCYPYFLFMSIFRKPPDKIFFDGVLLWSVTNDRWYLRLTRHFLIVLWLFITCQFRTLFTYTKSQTKVTANVHLTEHIIEQYNKTHRKEVDSLKTLQKNETFMAKLEKEHDPVRVEFDPEHFDVALDTCTTHTLTMSANDFVTLRPYTSTATGLGNAKITGQGHVRYYVEDKKGVTQQLNDYDAYLCPDLPIRLFSPISFGKQRDDISSHPNGDEVKLMTDSKNSTLTWQNGSFNIVTQHDPDSHLPIIRVTTAKSPFKAFASLFQCYPTVIPPDDDDPVLNPSLPDPLPDDETIPSSNRSDFPEGEQTNVEFENLDANPALVKLDDDQALLMQLHLKLGHLSFPVLQQAAKQGIFPSNIAKCPIPKCPGCLYGKAHRKPWKTRNKVNHIAKQAKKPGDCVSVDQLISATPGLVAQSSGYLTKAIYSVATIFVDNASGLDYVHIQETTSVDDTLEAKTAFESFTDQHGVTIKHYHADNGVFAAQGFRQAVAQSQQTISFCGVGAHHQNGIAERRIRDLTEMTRSMLLHAMHRNPAIKNTHWPYALRLASETRRCFPRFLKTKSPLELFTSVSIQPRYKHFHPFGCPAYVLTGPLQTNSPQPKWNERARVGAYLGHSPIHATSVSLIFNPKTRYISPQFHCVYDDKFETVAQDANLLKIWSSQVPDKETDTETIIGDYENNTIPESLTRPYTVEATPTPENEGAEPIEILQVENDDDFPPIDNEAEQQINEPIQQRQPQLITAELPPPEPPPVDTFENINPQSREIDPRASTRSGRRINISSRLRQSSILKDLKSFAAMQHQTIERLSSLLDGTINYIHPLSFAITLADPDTMTLSQALTQPDADQFINAMEKEVRDHEQRGHWHIVSKADMRKCGYSHHPIMAVWSMKRKRDPLGIITKYKARLCAHGGQTVKGIHYQESYSPVVAWTTIRLILILSLIFKWHTRQIDFVLAFPQAEMKADVYMQVPEKFTANQDLTQLIRDPHAIHPSKQSNALKLDKNLYGLKDASLNWFEHLKKGLLQRNFKQSEVDPCLFLRPDCIMICYVDDSIICSPSQKVIDDLVTSLEKDYTLTDEGDINAYLGIRVERQGDAFKLTQPHLIERILQAVSLKDQRQHHTPADTILQKDTDGPPRQTDFHYRSVIGMYSYLVSNTRPDMQMAVHQCSRFSNDPKLQHEQAIKRMSRYLKGTPNDGIIMKPDLSKGFECYVDADFAGTFTKATADDPQSCLSRTGYVIKFANCPLIWSSKMQSTIALSTTEAEYIALSSSLRDVIFLMQLLNEFKKIGLPLSIPTPIIKCKVFEDNVGALELANTPKLRPRTKHLAIQLHHFRSYVFNGSITISHVSTKEQVADILTKPLPRDSFRYLRFQLSGW
jgi:hypothetical protein